MINSKDNFLPTCVEVLGETAGPQWALTDHKEQCSSSLYISNMLAAFDKRSRMIAEKRINILFETDMKTINQDQEYPLVDMNFPENQAQEQVPQPQMCFELALIPVLRLRARLYTCVFALNYFIFRVKIHLAKIKKKQVAFLNEHLLSQNLSHCKSKRKKKKLPPKVFEYRSLKNYDKKAFINDLEQIPWSVIEGVSYIDNSVFLWEKLFRDCADHHAPIKSRRIKGFPTLGFLANFWN